MLGACWRLVSGIPLLLPLHGNHGMAKGFISDSDLFVQLLAKSCRVGQLGDVMVYFGSPGHRR